MDAVGVPLKNVKLVFFVHQGFSCLSLGPFDYPHYVLPTSVNSGYIAISVLFGFSQSWCGWTSYS